MNLPVMNTFHSLRPPSVSPVLNPVPETDYLHGSGSPAACGIHPGRPGVHAERRPARQGLHVQQTRIRQLRCVKKSMPNLTPMCVCVYSVQKCAHALCVLERYLLFFFVFFARVFLSQIRFFQSKVVFHFSVLSSSDLCTIFSRPPSLLGYCLFFCHSVISYRVSTVSL